MAEMPVKMSMVSGGVGRRYPSMQGQRCVSTIPISLYYLGRVEVPPDGHDPSEARRREAAPERRRVHAALGGRDDAP